MVAINTTNTLRGVSQTLERLQKLTGTVEVSSTVNLSTGRVGLLFNKPDGTSASFGDARNGYVTVGQWHSDTWVRISDNEWFRTEGAVLEGVAGGSRRIQKSMDGGATWTTVGSDYFNSSTQSLYEYGGIYDPVTDVGYVPGLIGTDGQNFNLILNKFTSKMTVYSGQIVLNVPSVSGWYRLTQGRIIKSTSGALLFAVTSSTDIFTSMDSPSGVFRCAPGLDPGVSSNWTYINGFGAGVTRGIIEPNIVQKANGDFLLEANTRTGFLVQQTWTADATVPGPTQVTQTVSPRTKADIIKLSDGRYARAYCSTVPAAPTNEGPRVNAVICFSEDLVTWTNYHVLALGIYIFELYLQEVNGKLRCRYWDWLNYPTSGGERPHDKYFDLVVDSQNRTKDSTVPSDIGTPVELTRAIPRSMLIGNLKNYSVNTWSVDVPVATGDVSGFSVLGGGMPVSLDGYPGIFGIQVYQGAFRMRSNSGFITFDLNETGPVRVNTPFGVKGIY